MTTFLNFLPSEYTVEILFCSATLFFLIFDDAVISYNKWNRPILVKNSFLYCNVILILAALYYIAVLELSSLASNYFSHQSFYQNFDIYQNTLFFKEQPLQAYEPYYNKNMIKSAHETSILSCKGLICIISILILNLIELSLILQKITFREFYFFFLIAILSSLLMINANDLLLFYLLLESQTLSFFVLACANRNSIYSVEAGLKYYLSSSFISCIFLLGAGLIYISYGSIGLADINQIMFSKLAQNEQTDFIATVGSIFVISALMFKVGLFPFHFWLPDVYEGAPLSSTIIFSLLPKLSLFHFFAKFILATKDFAYQIAISNIILTFGILSVAVGTFFALKQTRIKRIIAYSSVVQVGYIAVALSMTSIDSYTTAFFFIFIYILNSILIWAILVLLYYYQQNYKFHLITVDFESITGMSKYTLNLALFILLLGVAMFSIAGIPPFIGFTSKLLILNNLMEAKEYIASAFLLITSSVSVYYYIRILKSVYFENLKEKGIYKISNFISDDIISNENLRTLHDIINICIVLNILLFVNPHHLYSISYFIFESIRIL